MKKLRILIIIVSIFALFLVSVPAAANDVKTASYEVYGIEISPGFDYNNINWGATFVARATGTGGTSTNGTLSTSINYTPDDPVTNGTNSFVGGSWTLTVMSAGGNRLGTILGKIESGSITWYDGTAYGEATAVLKILGGTNAFRGIRGSGSFNGKDDHGYLVPRISGSLSLEYTLP